MSSGAGAQKHLLRGHVCAGAEGLGLGFCPPKHILSVFSPLSCGVGFLDLTRFCNPLVAPRDKCPGVSERPSDPSGCANADKNHCNSAGDAPLTIPHAPADTGGGWRLRWQQKFRKDGRKPCSQEHHSFIELGGGGREKALLTGGAAEAKADGEGRAERSWPV